jgi:hypothetical protein
MAKQSVDLLDFVMLGLEKAAAGGPILHAVGEAVGHGAPAVAKDTAQAVAKPSILGPAVGHTGRSLVGAGGGYVLDKFIHDPAARDWSAGTWPGDAHEMAHNVFSHPFLGKGWTFTALGATAPSARYIPRRFLEAGIREIPGEAGQVTRKVDWHGIGSTARGLHYVGEWTPHGLFGAGAAAANPLGRAAADEDAIHNTRDAAMGPLAAPGTRLRALQDRVRGNLIGGLVDDMRQRGFNIQHLQFEQIMEIAQNPDPNNPRHVAIAEYAKKRFNEAADVALQEYLQAQAAQKAKTAPGPTPTPTPTPTPDTDVTGGPGPGQIRVPGGPKPPPTDGSFTGNFPNWMKGVGIVGGALGAGALTHGFTGSDEDPETGQRRKRMPWLGPLVGAGLLGGGMYALSGGNMGRLTDPGFWKASSHQAIHRPMIVIPYQMKLAAAPPTPQPPAPPSPAPPEVPAAPAAPTPPAPPPPPLYQENHQPNYLANMYGLTPKTQPNQAAGAATAALGGAAGPLGGLTAAVGQGATQQFEGQQRSHAYAANALSGRLNQWRSQQAAYEEHMKANPEWKPPTTPPTAGAGAVGGLGGAVAQQQTASPWLKPGQEDLSPWFKGMPGADREHAWGLLREYQPNAVEHFNKATGYQPRELEQGAPNANEAVEGATPGQHIDETTGKPVRMLPQGTTARLAERAAQLNPQANDPNVQLNNLRNQLVQQGHSGPGILETVKMMWENMDGLTRVLVGAGLGLGAIGLLGTLTGSEHLGGGTGALLGLGGLAAAAWNSGAFDQNSMLRHAISGQLGQNITNARLPQVPAPIQQMNAANLGKGGFNTASVKNMILRAKEGLDPFDPTGTRQIGQEQAQDVLHHWMAGHTPDAREAMLGMFHDDPVMQQGVENTYKKTVPQYMKTYGAATDKARGAIDPGGTVPRAPAMGAGTPPAGTPSVGTPPPTESTPTATAGPITPSGPPITDMAGLTSDPLLKNFITVHPDGTPEVTVSNLTSLHAMMQSPAQREAFMASMARLPAPMREQLHAEAVKTLTTAARFDLTGQAKVGINQLNKAFAEFNQRMSQPAAAPGGGSSPVNPNAAPGEPITGPTTGSPAPGIEEPTAIPADAPKPAATTFSIPSYDVAANKPRIQQLRQELLSAKRPDLMAQLQQLQAGPKTADSIAQAQQIQQMLATMREPDVLDKIEHPSEMVEVLRDMENHIAQPAGPELNSLQAKQYLDSRPAARRKAIFLRNEMSNALLKPLFANNAAGQPNQDVRKAYTDWAMQSADASTLGNLITRLRELPQRPDTDALIKNIAERHMNLVRSGNLTQGHNAFALAHALSTPNMFDDATRTRVIRSIPDEYRKRYDEFRPAFGLPELPKVPSITEGWNAVAEEERRKRRKQMGSLPGISR